MMTMANVATTVALHPFFIVGSLIAVERLPRIVSPPTSNPTDAANNTQFLSVLRLSQLIQSILRLPEQQRQCSTQDPPTFCHPDEKRNTHCQPQHRNEGREPTLIHLSRQDAAADVCSSLVRSCFEQCCCASSIIAPGRYPIYTDPSNLIKCRVADRNHTPTQRTIMYKVTYPTICSLSDGAAIPTNFDSTFDDNFPGVLTVRWNDLMLSNIVRRGLSSMRWFSRRAADSKRILSEHMALLFYRISSRLIYLFVYVGLYPYQTTRCLERFLYLFRRF